VPKISRWETPEIAAFRASLVEKKLGEKRINNILAVLSKPLRYAADCELIAKAPRIGLFKVERNGADATTVTVHVQRGHCA
jgi:hypothetical protein